MEFRWIPGRRIDMYAVERMKQHFPVPSEPPRMAWFMDPRNQGYFPGLIEAITDKLDTGYIEEFLSDTGGGIRSFGRYEEWVVWFQCLLPYLFTHILEEGMLPLTINYFLNIYPGDILEEYPGFRDDVILTLPHAIMQSEAWDGQDLSKKFRWYDEWEGYWTCPLYATMFFCLKYLKPAEIPSWVASIVAITGDFWREQINKWLLGAERFFRYIDHPEELLKSDSLQKDYHATSGSIAVLLAAAGIDWGYSDLVFTGHRTSKNIWDYLPEANVKIFWSEVKKYPHLSFSDTPMN
jgi:hypothetical protein